MSYLALARKWRPKTFADVAGQGHVVRALENALGSGRLHHAFLFTGTRGIGKTTIARIFVKALNCERGVSATPCGACPSCIAIDAGRFVDFLEVDAASRTGIDDIREILDNAQYTPASGRFKVYLIDEVHMLSKQAFNGLLKTLEEPPPHIKFLLATTDPQKIPVTVLSRCLQFNLKRLPQAGILERLTSICASEGLSAESGALQRLARAAAGSMRDALSLLDQALAFGNGAVRDREVAEMLGSLDRQHLTGLLEALAQGDARGLMDQVRQLDELVPDYDDVLAGLAGLLQQIAVIQLAGVGAVESGDDMVLLERLAAEMPPETVQLMYQIAVLGRRDLDLAPDPRTGFEMTLLRVLAFDQAESPVGTLTAAIAAPTAAHGIAPAKAPAAAPVPKPQASTGLVGGEIRDWPAFVATLGLDAAARQLAANCALAAQSSTGLHLSIEPRNAHLLTESLKVRVAAAVSAGFGDERKVSFAIDQGVNDTVAARQARSEDEKQRKAREAIAADANVRAMGELFSAEVVADSVRPVPDTSSGKPASKK
jgi:DNA polymerase-3 subunit gamma/tau